MTNEEIKSGFVALFAEAHAAVDALEEGHSKTTAQRLLSMFHHAGEVFADHAIDEGAVTPFDGTDKPAGP